MLFTWKQKYLSRQHTKLTGKHSGSAGQQDDSVCLHYAWQDNTVMRPDTKYCEQDRITCNSRQSRRSIRKPLFCGFSQSGGRNYNFVVAN